jgi:LysM repeat protein
MKRKRSWIARFLALAALAAAIVAIVVVAKNTHLHSDSKDKGGAQQSQQHKKQQQQKKKPRTKAKTYEVQSGDTLISIAHKTGVPVAELQALNPEVDPQILVAGEVLKLQK